MFYYITHYTSSNHSSIFPFNFGASSKIEYVCDELAKKDDVTIVSFAKPFAKKIVQQSKFLLKDCGSHKIFVEYVFHKNFKFKPLRFIQNNIIFRKTLKKLALTLKYSDNSLVIYHSLFFLKLENKLSKLFKDKTIIHVEDLYSITFSDRYPKLASKKKIEINTLKNFKYGILITKELQDLLNIENTVISNGILKFNNVNENDNNKKNLLYSGIIDSTFNAAFNACEIIRHLPDDYTLTICGDGKSEELNKLNTIIQDTNKELGRNAIIFKGLLVGRELGQVYLNSDIGLSIENQSSNLDRQKYSFHSKILKYLSYGLPVVCTEYLSEKNSSISDLLTFVKRGSTALEIAKTINFSSFPTKQFIKRRMAKEYMSFSNNLNKLMDVIIKKRAT